MKICLVGVSGRALLGTATGGSEKQIALLARHFVRRGHAVTLLVSDHTGPDRRVDGIVLRGAWDPTKGIRWVRAATHRLPSLRRKLLEERADMYYVRGATGSTSVVVQVARRLDSPGLVGLSSDRDLYADSGRVVLQLGTSPADRVAAHMAWLALQRRALRTADVVVAQNAGQAARCAALHLPHVLIPSIVEEPRADLLTVEPDYGAVWVGNVHKDARRSKGIAELADLAARLPDVRFAVVGTLTAGGIDADVARLGSLANVDLLGAQTYEDTQQTIARSRVVLNTSPAEGFSNVMLEGWALAKPAITLAVNPSRLLGDDGLGWCAGVSIERMAALLHAGLADDAWLAATGRRARDYVRTVHDADVVCSRYEQLAVARR